MHDSIVNFWSTPSLPVLFASVPRDGILGWLVDYYLQATIAIAICYWIVHRLRNYVLQQIVLRGTVIALAMFAFTSCYSAWPRFHMWQSEIATMPAAETSEVTGSVSTSAAVSSEPAIARGPSRAAPKPLRGPNREEFSFAKLRRLVVSILVLGISVLSGWLALGWVLAERLRWCARPLHDDEESRFTDAPFTESLPWSRIRVSGSLRQPAAVGFWRPTILIPQSFLTLSSGEFRAAVLHEWSHIRRGDVFFRCLTHWLVALLYCHPGYWWLRRRAELVEELQADHAAAEGDQLRYAEYLISWVRRDRNHRWQIQVSAAGTPGTFKQRIKALLDTRPELGDRPNACHVSSTGSLVVIPLILLSFMTIRPQTIHPQLQTKQASDPTLARVATQPPVAPPKPTTRRAFRLPSGVEMRLVGVRREGESWWQKETSPTSGALPHELILDVKGRLSGPMYWQIDGEAGFLPSEAWCATDDRYRMSVELPMALETARLRLGYGYGDWTIHSSAGCGSRDLDPLKFSTCMDTNRGILLTINRAFADQEVRVIAIDRHGNRHASHQIDRQRSELLAAFPDIQPYDINEILVEARPLQWIELSNLSLSSGSQTNVRVIAEEPTKAS